MGTSERVLAGLGAVAVVAGAALGGPPRFDHVDGDAQWVVHVDLERMSRSEIGSWLLEQIDAEIAKDEIAASLKEDLRWGDDLRGVTLYGWAADEDEEESIVVVMYGSEALDELEERLWHGHKFLHGDDADVEVAGRPVMVLGEDDEEANVIAMRKGDDRVMVASPDLGWLSRAARVLDGRRDGMGGGAPMLELSSPSEGAMVVGAATDLHHLSGFDPVSEIAQQADGVFGSITERDGRARLELAMSAGDEEDARAIVDVVHGLVALGRLISKEDPQLRELLEFTRGLRFDAEGRMVRGSLAADAGAVREFLEEHVHSEDWEDDWDDERDEEHEHDHHDDDHDHD